MLNCNDIDGLMMDRLYSELADDRAHAFEAHVEGCARCQGEASAPGLREAQVWRAGCPACSAR